MASRPILEPFQVIKSQSMASDVISDVTFIQNVSMVTYDISWTGTPTGTFQVEVSDTYQKSADGRSVANAGNWTPVPLSITPGASGSAGNGFIELPAIGANAVRLHYVAGSGSGVLNAVIKGKVS